jgi:AcrR family transcriptional regulator
MTAAGEEFMEKGFAGAKTTSIARRAGVTTAMLHYYFRTKENLFDRVYREKARLMAGAFTAIAGLEVPFAEKVERGVAAHFDFLAANPSLPLFLLREIVGNPEREACCREVLVPVFREVLQVLREMIERERGAVEQAEVEDILLSMVSLNVFTFLSLPMFMMLTGRGEEEKKLFLQQRKEQIIQQVLARLESLDGKKRPV